MTRRAGIAATVILVLIVLLVWQCRDDAPPGPEPVPGAARDESTLPPPVTPDESPSAEPDTAPAEAVRRTGRLLHRSGEPARGCSVCFTGPGVVRRLEALKQAGQEVVAGEIRAARLEDGLLPPVYRAGRTDGDGRFEATWDAAYSGRVDLLIVREDAEGTLRIVHRIAGAETAVPDEIRIPATGAITGCVRGIDGNPVEKALVYCVPLDVLVAQKTTFFSRRATPFTGLFLMDWARHAQTGKDGRFRIAGLRPAPYRVFARRRDRGGTIQRIEVFSGTPNADQPIVLDTAGAYVNGWIVDERTSDPLSRCLVLADDPRGTTYSGADGTYRIGPLAPGEFHGFVLKTDYDAAPLGPFELVAGQTYEAPTTYLRSRE